MNAVTLRRLLVFGVCAVGVTALYLVPGVSGAPVPASGPRPDVEPTSRPSSTNARSSAATTAPDAADRTSEAAAEAGPSSIQVRDTRLRRRAPSPSPRSGATAFDPAHVPDQVPPAPVPDVETAEVTEDRLSLRWPPAVDNVGVASYSVWLNGFQVVTTAETHATVRWFNDDLRTTVVQVRALDAAGNVSSSSPNLLVVRPTPEPSEASTPTPSPTKPTPLPTEPSSPEPSSGATNGGAPSAGPSQPGPQPGEQPDAADAPVHPLASASASVGS